MHHFNQSIPVLWIFKMLWKLLHQNYVCCIYEIVLFTKMCNVFGMLNCPKRSLDIAEYAFASIAQTFCAHNACKERQMTFALMPSGPKLIQLKYCRFDFVCLFSYSETKDQFNIWKLSKSLLKLINKFFSFQVSFKTFTV